MRISIIQDIIYWADKDKNLQTTERKLAELSGTTDLVVLPEMFTTGFATRQLHLAEPMEGETVKTLKKWAMEYKFAIVGSFIAEENGKIFNRSFFVLPTGEVQTADKHHLFSMGNEQEYFSAGNKKLIVSYKDWNIAVLVCYDIRFPVWSRNVNNEYDLLIYVANFPHNRISEWDILLKARAIENQSYVCGVNRIGEDGMKIAYSGHSAVLDYKGKEILTFSENKSAVATVELSIEKLKYYREKFAVWKDADKFKLTENNKK